jgi:hypothetical protein
MPSVACPTCGEKGKIPGHFIGIRIKCKKCGNSFLVTPPAPKGGGQTTVEMVTEPRPQGIELEDSQGVEETGLWPSPVQATSEPETDHDPDDASVFSASQTDEPSGIKHYKVLTQKDKWFDGKFDLARLEEGLNHFAREGWVVRSMVTAQIASFSGGAREELIVLLER